MERPLILPAQEIRSIIRGTKRQLRRIVTVPWRGPRRALPYSPWWEGDDGALVACDEYGDYHPADRALGTWQVGMRIWVKEPWCVATDWYPAASFAWKADYVPSDWLEHCAGCTAERDGNKLFDCMACGFKGWHRAVGMPRRACRLVLELTEVRIERLQTITEEDAVAEGHDAVKSKVPRARDAFSMAWDERHGDEKGRAWERSPWVWRLAFRMAA